MKKTIGILLIIFVAVLIIVGGALVLYCNSDYFINVFIDIITVKAPRMKFDGNIQQGFFDKMTDEEREAYLPNHRESLERTMIEDVYFLINGKRVEADDVRIWLHAYTLFPNEEDTYTIKSVSLVTSDGQIIYEKNDCDLLVRASAPKGDIYAEGVELCTFPLDSDWYYMGNELVLNVETEKDGESVELSFAVNVGIYKYIPFSRI